MAIDSCCFFPSHSEPPQLILFASSTQRSYIIIFTRLVFCLSSRVQNENGTKKTNIHIIELIMFCGWRTKSPLFRCMFWSPATVTWIPKTTKSNYVTHFEAQNHEMHNNNQYRIHWNVLVHIIDVIACKLRWRNNEIELIIEMKIRPRDIGKYHTFWNWSRFSLQSKS